MITYDEEQQGWSFEKATDLEKQKITEIGERYFAAYLGNLLASQWADEAKAAELLEHMSTDKAH